MSLKSISNGKSDSNKIKTNLIANILYDNFVSNNVYFMII